MDLAEDWSNQEIIQAAAIGEFTSLDGIDWRNKAETSAGEIKFDDVLWKRIFSETSQFLKDSHFSKEDINVNTGTQMFVEGKSAMFHGQPRDMQKFQDQMDAELIRIPYFSQTSDSSFTTMLMTGFIILLFAGLFYSISRFSIANQKVKFEKRNNELQAMAISEMEEANKNLKKAKNIAIEALQTAENANKAKTDFLSNMSHDIRTPMNAIIGIISLIRHNAGDKEKVIEYADKIAISSQHLLGIINDVLDMSKIEAGKTVFKYSDFSILDSIEELNTIFHSQANEKNQSFIITKENLKHEWVNGDKVHLMQIFSNLLSNAIKYTQEGGIIQFIAEESETNSSTYGKYHFIVSDNGMGMSADFKETIFDAFTRAESSVTNKIQGTGLGMAITKNLVESMGGTIEVESEPNRGSCFEVILNLKIVENRVVSSTEQIEMYETDSDILDGMRFLCAEDNELNAEILMELLKLEGAECTICENGKRILEAFEQSVPGEYDMILMDVQMPVMNGYEATEAIRRSSHEQAKTIPIIAMTANAFSEDMQHSLAAGMNAHISKPVDMKLLKKTIRNIKLGETKPNLLINNH